jgi:hypothetical protein
MNIDKRLTNESINQNIINMKTFNNPEGLYIAKPKQPAVVTEPDAFTLNKLKGTPFVAYPTKAAANNVQPQQPAIALQDGMFVSYPEDKPTADKAANDAAWKSCYPSTSQTPKGGFFKLYADKWSGRGSLIFMSLMQRLKMRTS